MRIGFLKELMNTGFTECAYCGKTVPVNNLVNDSCPDCAKQK